MIVDTERDGWTRVGTLGWRKSLRDKHWAQIVKDPLGWAWTIHKADPVTMCPITVADGMDTKLSAAKDDVDHWARNYHRHAMTVVPYGSSYVEYHRWLVKCRLHGDLAAFRDHYTAMTKAAEHLHAECEAAWQRGER